MNITTLNDRKALEKAVKEFYIEHGGQEVKDRQKAIAELVTPAALAAAYFRYKNVLPNNPGGEILAAIPFGVAVNYTADAGRKQKILKDKGIDTNLFLPIINNVSPEARKKYFETEKVAAIHVNSAAFFKRLGQLATGSNAKVLKQRKVAIGKESTEAVTHKAPQSIVDELNTRYDAVSKQHAIERSKSLGFQSMIGVAGITGYKKYERKSKQ